MSAAPAVQPPAAYSAPALREADRLGISRWKMKVGEVPGAFGETLDDAGWEQVQVPGHTAAPARGKQTTIWLRGILDVPETSDPSTLALDLGARTGASTVWVNGHKAGSSALRNGPVFLPPPLPLHWGANSIAIKLVVGAHVGGVRWSGDAAAGHPGKRSTGMVTRTLQSSIDGSKQTLGVYIPRALSPQRKAPLVVALPGWDGNIHGFTHSRLMAEAESRGWVVLVPDPRGNVLYTGASERGVLEAIDLVSRELDIDPDRIYLTGVSMGGAGALQIAYHHPDRFAAVAAFYGDSRYEPRGYVRGILRDQETADRYSVLLFHKNARNTPVLLVHARDDRVSAFVQSEQLAAADAKAGLKDHRLVAPATGGHSLQVVEDAVPDMVDLFDKSRRQANPAHVSFSTSSADYPGAWWLRVSPRQEGRFANVDLAIDRAARSLRVILLDEGARLATVDLSAAGLATDAPIELRVESMRGPLQLQGLRGWSSAMLGGASQQRPLPVQNDAVTVPALAPGSWSISQP